MFRFSKDHLRRDSFPLSVPGATARSPRHVLQVQHADVPSSPISIPVPPSIANDASHLGFLLLQLQVEASLLLAHPELDRLSVDCLE